MALQRHKKSGLISFLDKTIEAKAAEAAATKSNEAPLKPAQKADNSSAIDNRAGSILSAGRGSVSDFGGPKKHIGS